MMTLEELTPLAKKLLIKTAQRWLFVNSPEGFADSFASLDIDIKTDVSQEEKVDGVLLFVKNRAALEQDLANAVPVLEEETVCWIAYPKKSSGINSGLEMTGNWSEIEKYNLRIVSAWTALRLRLIDQVKKSTISNAAIENNELNKYIDTKNRTVLLPDDVKQALKEVPEANEVYQKLAYSHQKEYVVWILTAKQEKTRTSRVQKMIEKLLEAK
jgi:hypothetical protein